jgi:antitoxin component of RelBE/YafQ-DinJ toxin-antitoxin module
VNKPAKSITLAMDKTTAGNVYVRWEIDDQLLDQLDQVAGQLNITRDEAIHSALREYMALRKKPPLTELDQKPKG